MQTSEIGQRSAFEQLEDQPLPEGLSTEQNDFLLVSIETDNFLDRSDPTGRNPTHSYRTLSNLNKYLDETDEIYGVSPGFMMGVLFHDVIDHGIVSPKPGQEPKTRAFLQQLYGQVEDKTGFQYGYGVAISAAKWEEQVAESWRTGAMDRILDNPDTFIAPEEEVGLSKAEQIRIFSNAITNQKDPADPEVKERLLKRESSEIFDLDVETIKEAMVELEVEGLLIKACELLDNFNHPPKDKPASIWRDCIEVFNCYSPALELFGFDRVAKDLRGKALEFFHEDKLDLAQNQRLLSEQNFYKVRAKLYESLGSMETGHEEVRARVKSVGSTAKKLSSENYEGLEQVPDGIGMKVIVSDEMDMSDMEVFAKSLREQMENHEGIVIGHPNPKEQDSTFEIKVPENGEDGYTAIHMTFYYEDTPFEIQVVRKTDDEKHKYARASHIFYSLKKEITPEDERILSIIHNRADHLKEQPLNRELRPNTWRYNTQLLPELETTVGSLYSTVRLDGDPLMVSKSIEDIFSNILSESEEEKLGTTFMPLEAVSTEQFFDLLNLIDPNLAQDESIRNAVELVDNAQMFYDHTRWDGRPAVEGHLLPTAIHSAIMAVSNGDHWDGNQPVEYLRKVIIASLLHDLAEDTKIPVEQIGEEFGPEVEEIVTALKSPQHIKNTRERRTAYKEQIEAHPIANLIKLSDRMQNHMTDLVYLSNANPPDPEKVEKIMKYFAKTDEHLTSSFQKLPKKYKKVQEAIWRIAEHFGYKSEG